MHQAVFNGWLDAELYVRYLRRIAQQRKRVEAGFAIAAAFFASSAFVSVMASATGWISIVLTLCASLASVTNSYLGAKSPVVEWSELASQWSRRSRAWNRIWLDVQEVGPKVSLENLNQALDADSELEQKNGTFPHRRKLLQKVQKETLHSLGLGA